MAQLFVKGIFICADSLGHTNKSRVKHHRSAWQLYLSGGAEHTETNGGAAPLPLHPLTYFREYICLTCSTAAVREHTINLQKLEPGLKIPLIKCWWRCLERCSNKYSAIKCFPRNWEKSWTIWKVPRLITAIAPAERCLGCKEHLAEITSFAGLFWLPRVFGW